MHMSSLIEQAAQRLEQLRQAGVEVSETSDALPVAKASGQKNTVQHNPSTGPRVEVDAGALWSKHIASPSMPRSRIADQFRLIKRPLLRNVMGRGAAAVPRSNLIMVTSALPGEGKTFTAINLAMSIATELDHTVLLVDADVSRPSVMNVLGLSPGPGLLDLVLDESLDLSSVLLQTNIDKLTLLPSGTPHPRATELLASDAMAHLLAEMSGRYADRIIVFDSPPLLLATEARVLASHMGQIVMVVQAGKTLQSDVAHALGAIESCPVKLMLLNQANRVSRGQYENRYGYGYGAESAYTLGNAVA